MHWIDPDRLPKTSDVVECFLLSGEGGVEVHISVATALPIRSEVTRNEGWARAGALGLLHDGDGTCRTDTC